MTGVRVEVCPDRSRAMRSSPLRRHAQRFGSFSVHMGKDSRRAHAKAGADRSDRRVLSGFGEKLLGHAGKLVEIPAARILKLEGKPARGAESSDRRGVKGQN